MYPFFSIFFFVSFNCCTWNLPWLSVLHPMYIPCSGFYLWPEVLWPRKAHVAWLLILNGHENRNSDWPSLRNFEAVTVSMKRGHQSLAVDACFFCFVFLVYRHYSLISEILIHRATLKHCGLISLFLCVNVFFSVLCLLVLSWGDPAWSAGCLNPVTNV